MMRRLAATLALSLAFGLPCAAQSLPTTAPEAVGLSAERLKRIDAVMERYVAEQRVAGVSTLILKDGKVVQAGTYGQADVASRRPMAPDTIFRLASMSKAVTSVAAMILVEEGALLLSDPVSKYIPSFAQTYVAVVPPAGAPANTPIGRVPAKRQITVRDLMTHTAGISYGDGALDATYKANGTRGWYCADRDETIGQFVDRLATAPFEAQPGERWVYGYGTDVLGRVVEVASGMPLDEFFRRRIFEPLKMNDAYFYLPKEKVARLATVYGVGPDGKSLVRAPEHGSTGQGEYVDGPRKCFAGGAGLVATIGDYGRLLQMLLNGGELDGVRVLSPASVTSMTSNHVGSLYQDGTLGFGLGFEVIEHVGRAGRLGAAGEFSWGSAYYPRYFVDPAHKLVAILMAQLIPANGLDLQLKFRSLVYQSLIGEAPAAAPPGRKGTGK